MNKLKFLSIALSFLISFNSFNHIAFANDHGEDEHIYEENENDYDNYNYDEIPDDLENEDDNQEEEKEGDDELYN
ncbi:hypothetical protein N9C35_03855 [Flavobacteriaceae bacterium]|nr:hypothetical protein [Flavobacteriaceae bacterium]